MPIKPRRPRTIAKVIQKRQSFVPWNSQKITPIRIGSKKTAYCATKAIEVVHEIVLYLCWFVYCVHALSSEINDSIETTNNELQNVLVHIRNDTAKRIAKAIVYHHCPERSTIPL